VIGEAALAWKLARGYRLAPWRSPFLRWRIETWSGIDAASITREAFLSFVWQHRAEVRRYLRWAVENSR
jgi:hypothetical protein